MADRINFGIADNADEVFYLQAEFAAGEAPAVGDISEMEIDVRLTVDATVPLATLKLTGGQIVLASTHETDTIGFRLTFAEGVLDPGHYFHDLIATVTGLRQRWFSGEVSVEQGVTRDD